MHFRRYLFIWLGLFLPTVAIGLLTVGLLFREQARLNDLAQRTLLSQAQTVADNASLIMAEIKTGVIDALQAASGDGNEAFRLEELTSTNPFVKATYIWSPDASGAYQNSFTDHNSQLPDELLNLAAPSWSELGNESASQNSASAPSPDTIITEDELFNEAPSSSSYNYANTQSKRSTIREFTKQNVARLNQLKVSENNFSDLDAESALSQLDQVEDQEMIAAKSRSGWLTATQPEPLWLAWYQYDSNSRVTGALLDTASVRKQLESAIPSGVEPSITYRILPPSEISSSSSSDNQESLIPISPELPDWQLSYTKSASLYGANNVLLFGSAIVAMLCTTSLGSGSLILWRARKDARDASQKSTFVSNVSHELRTPLTTIRMYAEMLEEGRVPDSARQKRYLQTITDESQRLTRLVDNILDFSHLEQGRKRYKPATCDPIHIVESALQSIEPRIRAAEMEVEWSPPETSTPIITDPDAVEQVLLNLLENAVKYAQSGKRIQVQLSQSAQQTCIAITDFGPGIAARDQKKIFRAFQRLDESLTSNQPGSGLGLSISSGIVRDLGGQILLQSSKPSGAVFIIQLPAKPTPQAS